VGLLAKVRREPVHALLGGPVRDELTFYATGARPDLAKEMGFIGGKLPLHHGPAEREEGLQKNLALLGDMRGKVGKDFWLMVDCWMSLDVDYATPPGPRGTRGVRSEVDRGGPAARRLLGLRRTAPQRAKGHACEHRRARGHALGFRMLLEMECCDILQPDVGWCGGITELIKIRPWPTHTASSSCRMARPSTATTS